MRKVQGLAVLACLMFSSTARSSEGEEIAREELPQVVSDHLRQSFPGAELLHAWKEEEDGKKCYIVRIMDNGRVIDLYASPDGRALLLKQEVYSLSDVPGLFVGSALFVLLPAVFAGAVTRWMAEAGREDKLSVLSEWLAAWIGAVIIIAIILSSLTTVPRDKDWFVIGLLCVVWGCIAASIVEALGLTMQSIRGYRNSSHRRILGLCGVAFVFLSIAVPVNMLHKHRENQHYLALALRPATS